MESTIQERKAQRVAAPAEEKIYIVPVVVHVIYTRDFKDYFSDERIRSQIRTLNEDYTRMNADSSNTPAIFKHLAADIKIEFCLATTDPDGNSSNGIIRKTSPLSYFNGYADDNSDVLLKSMSRWPSDKYLNIWVTNMKDKTDTSGGVTLGYSFIPGSSAIPDLDNDIDATRDGVVIHYSAFGYTGSKYGLGRTTTHEVGHWLGLRHIWGDTDCGTDFVDDTPIQRSSNIDMDKKLCINYSNCTGVSTLDMSNNYMDYSPDDCMNMFTKGQKFRMRTVMETNESRISVKNSTACSSSSFKMILYPNPAFSNEIIAEIIYYKPTEMEYKVYNSLGKLMTEDKSTSLYWRKQIDLTGYQYGMYVMKATIDGHVTYKKFLVE